MKAEHSNCRQSGRRQEAGTKRGGGFPAKKREHLSPHVTKTRRGSLLCPPSCHLLHLILAGAGDMNKSSFSNSRQKERAFISTCHKDQRRQGILALSSCRLLQKDKMAYLVVGNTICKSRHDAYMDLLQPYAALSVQ